MADYVYLFETRLTPAQKSALIAIRDIARAKGMTSFLTGGAIRDLSSGSPVRDLDVTVQGNALKLRKEIEKIGGSIHGENEASQSLYVKFPGGVRMEVVLPRRRARETGRRVATCPAAEPLSLRGRGRWSGRSSP